MFSIRCYYGHLGAGKTTAMTSDILYLLDRGFVVYSTYKINWNGRKFRRYKFGKIYKEYPKTNLRFVPSDDRFYPIFMSARDCIFALDECYYLFSSYQLTKIKKEHMQAIFQSRKYNRSIYYTSQRVMNVHITLRTMTTHFFKIQLLGFVRQKFAEYKKQSFFILLRKQLFDLKKEDEIEEKPLKTYYDIFRFRKVFGKFDTNEIIGEVYQNQDNLPRVIYY